MKTKQPVPDDKEQYKRFLETAEKIKADNDKELFKQVCDKIIKPKQTNK
jgi:hypothetical protein